jgi:murein DD-endopeptidase MepM/ murein hydrolase activator NlpD
MTQRCSILNSMKRRSNINEEFNILGSLHSAARSFMDLPIVKSATKFMSSDDDEEAPVADGGKESEKLARSLEQAATETVPLNVALELDTDKRALILGSSQAAVVGYPVMKALESRGFNKFSFDPTPAKTMRFVFSYAASVVKERETYDAIIIFPGYRYGETPDTIEKIIELFTPARCFVVAPPPVTRVTNPLAAAKLGLNKGNPVPDNYWFALRKGAYAREREDFCKSLESSVSTAGATYIDPRELSLGGEMQESGVQFPDSADGIHPEQGVVTEIARAVLDAIYSCTLPVPSVDVLGKITPELLARRPDIARQLSGYAGISGVLGAAGKTYATTSGFGARRAPKPGASSNHKGIDIGMAQGTPVKSILPGTAVLVVDQLPSPTAGLYVNIDHGGGIMSRYLHASQVIVKKGQRVAQGEVVILSGNSGVSTGPHLHFEILVDGRHVDPIEWLKEHPEATPPVQLKGLVS